MTKQQIQERKAYLIQTIDARDVLARYGVKIIRLRCKCPFHSGKDYNAKVFHNGILCFVCGTSFDIFQIVQHFEHCDFWTAFQILGGTDCIDEKTERIMAEAKKKCDAEIEFDRKRKEKIAYIVSKINMCERLKKQTEPLSEEWCYVYNRWFYWMYLFEYFTGVEGK